MDPDETLYYILTHANKLLDVDLTHEEFVNVAMEMAEAFRDLDNWIRRGGFLPNDWQLCPKPLPER